MVLTSGAHLGPYEILSPLGAGGMGEVYRARDTRLGRDVAIKVLPASFASDQDRVRRFEQEARSVAVLNHPNILALYDVGSREGTPYLVHELLEGETLAERLRLGALPLRKALDIAVQVARGVAAAHENGIIHRDLKPANVFLTADGHVKVLDFGLAKVLVGAASGLLYDSPTAAATAPKTESGMVLGTVGYMSPEQVRGKPADARADIFALGTILYEMLSGRRAFEKESSADTMAAILKEEPAELSGDGTKIPPAVDRMVRHCLEKNPVERFQSARDLAFALESAASPSTPDARVSIEPRKRWSQSWLVAAALTVVLAGVAWLGFLAGTRRAQFSPPSYLQLTLEPGYAGPARFSRDGSAVVYSAAWNGAPLQLYFRRTSGTQSRPLGVDADVFGHRGPRRHGGDSEAPVYGVVAGQGDAGAAAARGWHAPPGAGGRLRGRYHSRRAELRGGSQRERAAAIGISHRQGPVPNRGLDLRRATVSR